jgi:hypothetical protein
VPTGGVIGCGGGGVAIAYIGGGTVLAQEVGHAFGRAHAPCGNPGGPDPNYPTYDSYPSGSIGEFGFDSMTSSVMNPASTFDFMSYCGPVWVSPYTYIGLKNGITSSMAAAHPERPQVRSVMREFLYLNFRMRRDGNVQLLPSFHLIGSSPEVELGPASPFSCDLLSKEGDIVESHHCHLRDPHQDPMDPYIDFHEAIPWDSQVTSITFRRDGEVVHTLEIEETPPEIEEVAVQVPKADARAAELIRVKWAIKKQVNSVTYVLRYSHDEGKTWRAIAADLTEPGFVVNANLLPGGDRCKFQVVASSGIRTVTADSEYFSTAEKPRQAHILSPKPGVRFKQGELVVLQGGGFSPDFGMTDFDDVLWTSNRDGAIGVGYEVVTHTLSAGRHRITLTVPDGLGGEATTAASIEVAAEDD